MKRTFTKKPINSASEGNFGLETQLNDYISSYYGPTLLRIIKDFVESRMEELEYDYVEPEDIEEISRFTPSRLAYSLQNGRDDGDGRWDSYGEYEESWAYIYLLDNMPSELLESLIANEMNDYDEVLDTTLSDGRSVRDIVFG